MENMAAIPSVMTAIDVQDPGPNSRLSFVQLAVPTPTAHQVLVKVDAAGVNRADLAQRAGIYPPPAGESPILGLEVAGTVVAVGRGVGVHGTPEMGVHGLEVGSSEVGVQETAWLGRRIYGLVPGGGYAEYAVLPKEHCLLIPDAWTPIEAAATAEVFLTAYQALFSIGQLQARQHVLVHAGASGVGTAAIQLAKQVGANIAVTVGTDEKAAFCRALGADHAINYRSTDFVSALKTAYPTGFDVIIDPVAGPYLNKDCQLLAQDGRIIVLAMMGGREVPSFDLAPLFKKRGQLICSTLRNRSDSYKTALCQAFSAQFGQALQQQRIKPVIAEVFDWQDATQAHALLANNQVAGKIVLTIG